MRKQRPAPLVPDAGNLVKLRGRAALAATGPVPDDREAVRFVADLLDQVQAWMLRRQRDRRPVALDDQFLHAGLALRPFRHAYDTDVVQPEFDERRTRLRHLPFAAV